MMGAEGVKDREVVTKDEMMDEEEKNALSKEGNALAEKNGALSGREAAFSEKKEAINTPSKDNSTSSKEDNPPVPSKEVRFSFGPNGQYFFALSEEGKCLYHANLAKDTAKLVSEVPLGNQLYAAAIAADGGIFIGCANLDNRPYWTYIGPAGLTSLFEVAYKTLLDKIASNHKNSLSDLSHINLTLGPNGSYFTQSKDGPLWRDIPPALEKEIEDKKKDNITPRQVALGRKGSYTALWSNDRWSYSLNDDYAGLPSKFDKYKEDGVIAFVALDPYQSGSWLLVDADGLIYSSFKTMDTDNLEKIQEIALAYMQRRARKTGMTFTNTFTTSKTGSRSVTITPDTKHDRAKPKEFPKDMEGLRLFVKKQARDRPVWQPVLVSAGAVGLSSAGVCRLLRWPTTLPYLAGIFAGSYVYGYLSGQKVTLPTGSA